MMARGRFLERTKRAHHQSVVLDGTSPESSLTHRSLVPSLAVGGRGEQWHCYQRLGSGSYENPS